MNTDLEKITKDLENLRNEYYSDRKTVKIIGIVIAIMLGGISFIQIPRAVEQQIDDRVKNNIQQTLNEIKTAKNQAEIYVNELINILDTNKKFAKITISGKHKFSGIPHVGQLEDSEEVRFPVQFKTPPTVVVTQEVPNFEPFADGFLAISQVTSSGFKIQRRNPQRQVWNDSRVTINYIAVGEIQ
jgi:hypothetical protein